MTERPALTLWQPWASLCVLPRPCHPPPCPDGGTCHHDCTTECFRVACCAPLTGYGTRWPTPPTIKTIETRSWPAPKALIGQRIAIHAAKKVPQHHSAIGEWTVHSASYIEGGPQLRRRGSVHLDGTINPRRFEDGTAHRLPLGAIVGTAVLADCVPMVRPGHPPPSGALNVVDHDGARMLLRYTYDDVLDLGMTVENLSDQLPFGDFASGRWAWLLADAERFDEPIPAVGRQGIWKWRQ